MSDRLQLETILDRLDVLTPKHCASILQYFDQNATETATVSDLGAFVHEQNRCVGDETDIAIHLHHSTLPKLADAGLVEYDPRSKTARYRGLSPEEPD